MLIAADIRVNGQPTRVGGFEVGRSSGSPAIDFSITPKEDQTVYDPPDDGATIPVDIRLTALGKTYDLLLGGRIRGVDEDLSPDGFGVRVVGSDGTWRLLEKGPVRDTVFVPRTIIREIYPLGMKIFTSNGESVLGIPPEVRRRTPGAVGVADTGSVGGGATREMIDDFDWIRKVGPSANPVCDPLEAFNDAYAKASLPEFVIVGGDAGIKHRSYLPGEDEPDDACHRAQVATRRMTGGVNRVTILYLIELMAKKAGFTAVKSNLPDMTMFEPFTVSAGSTWWQAISSLVQPFNAHIEPDGTTLLIFDVEAADLARYRSITLSGEGIKVISRQVSRIPAFRGVNTIGPLRAALEALREFVHDDTAKVLSAGTDANDEDPCTPPRNDPGDSCAENGLPPGFKIAPPSRDARAREIERDERGGIPEVYISGERPYNIAISRTFGKTGISNIWGGHEAYDWQTVTVRKLYFADPALGRIQLRFLERKVTGNTGGGAFGRGTLSRQVTRIFQGRFGNSPCQVVNEEYGHVRLPGLPFGGERLLRRTITTYTANLDVEGTFDAVTDEYMLVVYTLGSDGGFYKPIPYQEAAHSGSIDLSANSLDSWRLAHYSRTIESFQVIDKYFAQKDTVTLFSFGGQQPTGDFDVIMMRDARDGFAPSARQRFCGDFENDGELVRMVLAVGAATLAQAKLFEDREKRRSGQRSVRMEIEVPTFLPHVRSGTGITIGGVPFRTLDAANTAMVPVTRLAGDYFVIGWRYVAYPVENGAFRVHTRLSLRSQF